MTRLSRKPQGLGQDLTHSGLRCVVCPFPVAEVRPTLRLVSIAQSVGRCAVQAHKGDRLVIDGKKVGQHQRSGEVLDVEGASDHQRLRVRWDDGHESLFMPGFGARIEPSSRKRPS